MRIEQLMTEPPLCCRPEYSLARAVQLMWDHDCGWLPVVAGDGPGRLVGVVTDRDICMAIHFEQKPPGEIRVADAMTHEVWACNPGDSLDEAAAIMREARVRRLPVVSEEDRLLGILSLADLAREAVRRRGSKQAEITEAEVGVVLAMICQPRLVVASASAAR